MIIEQFDVSIIDIEKSNDSLLVQLNLKIKRTQVCLNELRQVVKLDGFTTIKKEIQFFKYQKPYIKGRLIFYVRLNSYLLEKPKGGKTKLGKFVNFQLSQITKEYCKYIDFVNYYKLEESKRDQIYFLRGVEQFELFIDNTTIYEDPEFSTLRDHLASKIIANDLLIQFYTNQLENLKKNNDKQEIQEVQKTTNSSIPWTGSKTELVELLKSLNSQKSIANGNLTVKQLNEICINFFGVDPGNIHKILEQIRSRKSNHAKFLEKLSKSLLNEIEQDWENS